MSLLIRSVVVFGCLIQFPLTACAAPDWLAGWSAASSQASRRAQPILIYFRASACPWCDKLDQEFFASAETAKTLRKFACIRVANPEPTNALRKLHRIESYPSLVVVHPSGKSIRRWIGYQSDSVALLQELNQIAGEVARVLPVEGRMARGSATLPDLDVATAVYARWEWGAPLIEAQRKTAKLDPVNKSGVTSRAAARVGRYLLRGATPEQRARLGTGGPIPYFESALKLAKVPGERVDIQLDLVEAYLAEDKLAPAQSLITTLAKATSLSKLQSDRRADLTKTVTARRRKG